MGVMLIIKGASYTTGTGSTLPTTPIAFVKVLSKHINESGIVVDGNGAMWVSEPVEIPASALRIRGNGMAYHPYGLGGADMTSNIVFYDENGGVVERRNQVDEYDASCTTLDASPAFVWGVINVGIPSGAKTFRICQTVYNPNDNETPAAFCDADDFYFL